LLPPVSEYYQTVVDWVASHTDLLTLVGAASGVVFVASLASLPWLAASIPTDYFCRDNDSASRRHPLLAMLRNLAGAVLLLCGMAMLVLPGQGILTILIALVLMDYPGKKQLEHRIVSLPSVLKSMNWLRRQRGAAPLQLK